jgi:hypothetical protein
MDRHSTNKVSIKKAVSRYIPLTSSSKRAPAGYIALRAKLDVEVAIARKRIEDIKNHRQKVDQELSAVRAEKQESITRLQKKIQTLVTAEHISEQLVVCGITSINLQTNSYQVKVTLLEETAKRLKDKAKQTHKALKDALKEVEYQMAEDDHVALTTFQMEYPGSKIESGTWTQWFHGVVDKTEAALQIGQYAGSQQAKQGMGLQS